MKERVVDDVIMNISNARQIAEDWVAAWNARDLERILSHYAEDVVFFSPSVVTRYGEPTGALHGKHALREHFRRGLETFGANVRFTIIDVLSGINGYTVYYFRENGAAVVDTVVVDTSGKGVLVHAHYRAAHRDFTADPPKAADC
jgi:ketosteroid isomerase-like protein